MKTHTIKQVLQLLVLIVVIILILIFSKITDMDKFFKKDLKISENGLIAIYSENLDTAKKEFINEGIKVTWADNIDGATVTHLSVVTVKPGNIEFQSNLKGCVEKISDTVYYVSLNLDERSKKATIRVISEDETVANSYLYYNNYALRNY